VAQTLRKLFTGLPSDRVKTKSSFSLPEVHAVAYVEIGQPEKAIQAGQQALRVNASHALPYASLGRAYERATRFAEAKAICEKAIAEKVDSSWTHQQLYRIAFVEGDEPTMQREIDWFKGKPQESVNLYYQAKAALSLGQIGRSRELFERARALSLQQERKETAVSIINGQAQFDADTAINTEARSLANLSLHMMPNSPRHNAFATLTLARAGDSARAQALLNGLSKLPWLGTDLKNVLLPSIRAAIQLDRKNPAAAVEELPPAVPYDLGDASSGLTLYYRGLAYLELKSGQEAAAQFQKIVDNRGVVTTDSYWPLAHLGLARALAQTRETEKSLAQYREFLELWKNADPDLQILKQAKAAPMHTAPKPYTDKGCRGWFMVLSEGLHFPDYLGTSPPNSPSSQWSERSPTQ